MLKSKNVKTTNDGYTRDLTDNVAIGASNSPVTWSNLDSNYAYKYYYLHLLFALYRKFLFSIFVLTPL